MSGVRWYRLSLESRSRQKLSRRATAAATTGKAAAATATATTDTTAATNDPVADPIPNPDRDTESNSNSDADHSEESAFPDPESESAADRKSAPAKRDVTLSARSVPDRDSAPDSQSDPEPDEGQRQGQVSDTNPGTEIDRSPNLTAGQNSVGRGNGRRFAPTEIRCLEKSTKGDNGGDIEEQNAVREQNRD